MTITNSPDISLLSVQVTFDLSGTLPVVSLVNLSEGPNLGNITWWFLVLSPTQTIIHQGSFANPDVNGSWATFVISDSWPRPFNSIEFSGAPYNLTVYIQDSIGNQYSDSNYNASICRPNGNNNLSKNFYGVSSTNLQLQCQQASLYFQDKTNASYKGLFGTLISSILRVVYPIDETGNIPAPFVITNFSSASAPISYSSNNYQFQTQIVYDYDFGNNIHVRIRYQSLDPKDKTNYVKFPVLCNIDLSPLICEFRKLVDSLENGTCSDVQETERKLMLINPKMSLIGIGLFQPLTGLDVPTLIQEVESIGGFSCDCCNAPSGVIPTTSSVIGGYTFTVVPTCGDITGSFVANGTNIQLLLQDKSYNFVLSGAIPTAAFTISPATSGCTKAYTFNVNLVTLSTDILNTIKGNGDLINLFNSINPGTSGSLFLSVDGKCIFTSTSAFNYTFTLTNIPSTTTFAILSQITNGSSVQNLNFSFNLTNLSALQSYLNGLGIGVFLVTNPSGQTVLISSSNNPNNLSILTYSISSTNYIANATSTAAGYVPIPANQVIQNIINWMCGITDEDVFTSQAYTISYIDGSGKQAQVTVDKGSTLSALIQALLTAQSEIVTNVGTATDVSCTTIQNSFPSSTKPILSTDYILGNKSGLCAQVSYADAFLYMLTAALTNVNLKNAFCSVVESCGAGLSCSPYTFFDVIVTNYNNSCAPIVGIGYTLS